MLIFLPKDLNLFYVLLSGGNSILELKTERLNRNAEIFYAGMLRGSQVVHTKGSFKTAHINATYDVIGIRRRQYMILDEPQTQFPLVTTVPVRYNHKISGLPVLRYPIEEIGPRWEMELMRLAVRHVAAREGFLADFRVYDPVYEAFKKFAALSQSR